MHFILFSWLISSYCMIFFKKYNCGYTSNCRPESEFIEDIVENILKKLNEESSTAPSLRQNDAPGQHSSATIPHNDASSGQNTTINAIADWTRFFFFQNFFFPLKFAHTLTLIPLTFSVFFYIKKSSSLSHIACGRSKWSRFQAELFVFTAISK